VVALSVADPDQALDVRPLIQLRDDITGGPGLRSSVRVGRRYDLPGRLQAPTLTQELLTRIAPGTKPAPIQAAYIRLRPLPVHPFANCNCRTRLAASLILMQAGYHSTLHAAIEQQSAHQRRYVRLIGRFRDGKLGQREWIVGSVRAMAAACFGAWALEMGRRPDPAAIA
jgi:hypothetical protein